MAVLHFILFLSIQNIFATEIVSQESLQADIEAIEKALSKHREQNPYIVIDTQHNKLQIWKNNQIVHQAICATGSGKVLLHPQKSNRWQFNTPRGLWHVQKKVTDPIWAKPQWAFVENGTEIPRLPWEFRRLDPTTLGAYALELGDGYEIHGTLYPSLLGKNITHGCIRLNDEDLALTYQLIDTGNRVYIY